MKPVHKIALIGIVSTVFYAIFDGSKAVKIAAIRFPVDSSGKPNFGPTFGAARGTRTHKGVDIFAKEGTPVFATVDGIVSYSSNKLGGMTANLTGKDGTWYYYAHLSGYEGEARTVLAGETIGYVGNTGNAINTPPHLHFEIHPHNGPAVDPFVALKEVAPAGSVTA